MGTSYPGRMVGYTSCLTAGVAKEIMLAPKNPDIRQGIRAGLSALRCLHREGYGQRGASTADVQLNFPGSAVVSAMANENTPFEEVAVPMRSGNKYWTILDDRYPSDLEELASKVVLNGPEKELKGVPLGRFGALLTVDRQEIESLRSIGSLVSEYVAQPRPKRPLSIAVFGPPGSGKSFGITQLALALRLGEIEVRVFNLSQMRSTDELLSAFHQVRDIGLGGKIPLIFWDEFDSHFEGTYGWLRYFLSPMQDGMFQQGNLAHPIGKAIFVFAGGTSWTLDNFGKNVIDEKEARAAKVPDFISRLKGYLNVLGPNPQPDQADPYYVLRRALLLRSMLERDAKQVLRKGQAQIDSGVLRAMLMTWRYKHGARSDGIAHRHEQARWQDALRALQPAHQSAVGFARRWTGFPCAGSPTPPQRRGSGEAGEVVHQVFCNKLKARGWKSGPKNNEKTKEHSSLVKWDDLPRDEKEQPRSGA